jgi:hypothetical protein
MCCRQFKCMTGVSGGFQFAFPFIIDGLRRRV